MFLHQEWGAGSGEVLEDSPLAQVWAPPIGSGMGPSCRLSFTLSLPSSCLLRENCPPGKARRPGVEMKSEVENWLGALGAPHSFPPSVPTDGDLVPWG